MAKLVIESIEDDVVERLERRARKHGWSLEELVRDILRDAANDARPTGGLGGEIAALFPMTNRREDSAHNRFSVTAEDVRDAEKAAREKKLDVVGWYHSHPDHPARPSQYDREHAWPWYSYVIVSVANGKPAEMTSWRLSDDRSEYACEEIAIRDRAARS